MKNLTLILFFFACSFAFAQPTVVEYNYARTYENEAWGNNNEVYTKATFFLSDGVDLRLDLNNGATVLDFVMETEMEEGSSESGDYLTCSLKDEDGSIFQMILYNNENGLVLYHEESEVIFQFTK